MSSNSGTKRKWAARCGTGTAQFTAQMVLCCSVFLSGCYAQPAASNEGLHAQQIAEGAECIAAQAIDGDTIRCANGPHIRLASIDAPELPGHCRTGRRCVEGDGFASKAALAALIAGHDVRCVAQATDNYGRTIAKCSAGGADLSCAMVESGYAVERYGRLDC